MLVLDPDRAGAFDLNIYRGMIGGEFVDIVAQDVVLSGAWSNVEVMLPEIGEQFVFVEVRDVEADRFSWSAPIWIDRLLPNLTIWIEGWPGPVFLNERRTVVGLALKVR